MRGATTDGSGEIWRWNARTTVVVFMALRQGQGWFYDSRPECCAGFIGALGMPFDEVLIRD